MEKLISFFETINLNDLYLFQQFNRKILMDIPSGCSYPISEAAWDILDHLQRDSTVTIEQIAYNRQVIEQSIAEIKEKINIGQLCTGRELMEKDPCPTGLLSVLLNITHNCNLACKYCIMGLPALQSGYQGQHQAMALVTALTAVDFIYDRSVSGVNLTFFGGEPLLEYEKIVAVIEYAENKYPGWFQFNVITNGTLLNEEMVKFFDTYRVNFLFSIDGDQAVNDTLRVYKQGEESVFKQSFSHLRMLEKNSTLNYKVNITYFKPTMNIADAFHFFSHENIRETRFERGLVSIDSPYAVTMADIEYVKEQFAFIAKDYRDSLLAGRDNYVDNLVILMKKIAKKTRRYRGCNMGIDFIAIAYDGRIYPCHKMVGDESQCLGDIENGWDNTKQREIWQQDVTKRPLCAKCWAKFLCGGFCISDNYHTNKDYFQPVAENCEIMKNNIRLALWLYYELEEKAPAVLKKLLEANYILSDEIPYSNETVISWLADNRVKNIVTEAVYELNPVALRILQLCDGKLTMDDIVNVLVSEFTVSRQSLLHDVRSYLVMLLQNDLIGLKQA